MKPQARRQKRRERSWERRVEGGKEGGRDGEEGKVFSAFGRHDERKRRAGVGESSTGPFSYNVFLQLRFAI